MAKPIPCWALYSLVMTLSGCAVKPAIQEHFIIDKTDRTRLCRSALAQSIYLPTTTSADSYDSNSMRYMQASYNLQNFAHSDWTATPAEMFGPLLGQSLEHSGCFRAISSGVANADYRLDSQIISLHQNFMSKPSHTVMSVKITLSNNQTGRGLFSRTFTQSIPCPSDNPYGGVIAANIASQRIAASATRSVVAHLNG